MITTANLSALSPPFALRSGKTGIDTRRRELENVGLADDKDVTRLELLAPAGNVETGMAAIDHGADAVYIGAPRFSARAQADQDLAAITRLIDYAHLYWARVYVALNTVLTDREIPQALAIIEEIYRSGADGLIIQDFGLLEMDLPPIPLIASTQMHNDTVEKVQFLESAGFTRVILARELSLHEISTLRRNTRIDLEVFVHGALCVSYSGQCYMSQAAMGRSGNRGVCAQPCRFPYTLVDGDGIVLARDRFLLSLKDLCRLDVIPELVAAGVTSFKIEGRYKGRDYVKNVTAAYRQAIDLFIAARPGYGRSSSGTTSFTFLPDVQRTFNRGYTGYFIRGKRDKMGSPDTPKWVGQNVGSVTGVGKDFFTLIGHDLSNGDGLCFFTARGDLTGFRVDRVQGDTVHPSSMKDLAKGTILYRNRDAAFTRLLGKTSADRRLAIEMDFRQEATEVRLTARDEDGNEAERAAAAPFEQARDPLRARARIEKQLSSTGSTPYRVIRLDLLPPEPGFLPVALLNGLRRDVLEALTRKRLQNLPRQKARVAPDMAPYPVRSLDYRANVLNGDARRFYERHGVTSIEPAFETLPDGTGKAVMLCRYCIRHQLDMCPRLKGSAPVAEPLRLKDRTRTYRLEFDCGHCLMSVILEGPQDRFS